MQNEGMNETKGTAKETPREKQSSSETQESPECVPRVTELQGASLLAARCQEGTVPHTSHVWEQRQSEASFRSPCSWHLLHWQLVSKLFCSNNRDTAAHNL